MNAIKCLTANASSGISNTTLGGNTQLCLSQNWEIEHAIHSLRLPYEKLEIKAVVLIDAKNVFNCLNHDLAVDNVKRNCPALSFVVQSSYSAPSGLYVAGRTLQSLDGTTQGDLIAMAIHGVATLLLLRLVQNTHVSQKWNAEVDSTVGPLEDLFLFFKQLTEHGGNFGYSECPEVQLIVKEISEIKRLKLFEGTPVEIVDGCRVLGSIRGNEKAYETFKLTTAGKYANLLKKLGKVTKTCPQKLLRMPHRRRATKIKFSVQDNAKLTENLHRRRRQHPKAHPAIVL